MTKFHRYERKLDHDGVRRHFDKILQAPETTPEVYEIVANFMNRCLEGEFYLDSPCICIDNKINAIYDTLERTIDLIDHQHKGEPPMRKTFPAQVTIEKIFGRWHGCVSPALLKLGCLDPMVTRKSFSGDTVDEMLAEMHAFAREQLTLVEQGKCPAILGETVMAIIYIAGPFVDPDLVFGVTENVARAAKLHVRVCGRVDILLPHTHTNGFQHYPNLQMNSGIGSISTSSNVVMPSS